MPPRRPGNHVNADKAVARLHVAFVEAGWTVEDLYKDYGEDLLVRLFKEEEATPFFFYVQVKSTTSIDRFYSKDRRFLRYPFTHDHLVLWREFWEPVVLAIWDADKDVVYWEIAQEPLKSWDIRSKNAYCYVPVENTLDVTGLQRLATRTRRRHRRFELEKQGVQVLVEMLQDLLNLTIDYNPQAGMLFVTYPDGTTRLTAFGRTAERYARMANESGLSVDDWLNRSVLNGSKIWLALEEGATLLIRDAATEEVQQEWDKEGLESHLRKIEELDEP